MPKLSVIIPVYNVEKYLPATLDSIINQTLTDIEIICVNDGSTDNSLHILQEYAAKDNRITIIDKKNGGLSSARNAGIAVSKSDLLAFMDSDDILAPNAYEVAVSKMTDDINFVIFGIQTVGTKNKEIQKSDDEYYRIKYSGKTKITTDVLNNMDLSSCNKIFRKSFMQKHKLSYPEGLRYEDAYFFILYGLQSSYGFFITDKFYTYIRREDSIMGQTFTHKSGVSIDHLKITIKIYEYLKENKLLEKNYDFFWNLFFIYFELALRYEPTKEGQNEIYNMAIKFFKTEKVHFKDNDIFKAKLNKIQKKSWYSQNKNISFVILKIKQKQNVKRILFCGIPLLRIKYEKQYTTYYLFAVIPVWKKASK